MDNAVTKTDTKAISDDRAETSSPGSIDPKLIENINVTLEAYVGEARLTVGQLTELRQGAIVQLDAPLNHTVELRLNGLAVARGELVAAGDRFGVRLVEITR